MTEDEERICALLRPPHDAAYRLVCADATAIEIGQRFGANDPDVAEAHGKRVQTDMARDLRATRPDTSCASPNRRNGCR